MMIAHLPSGYLIGRCFRNRTRCRAFLVAALVGAIAPDIDMIAFLVDGSLHHHAYPTHWPLAWAAIGVPTLIVLYATGYRTACAVAAVFLLAVLVHLVLDSVAAPLFWLRPFSDGRVELFPVPAAYGHWIVSMVLHWTFLFEIGICLVALGLLIGDIRGASRER